MTVARELVFDVGESQRNWDRVVDDLVRELRRVRDPSCPPAIGSRPRRVIENPRVRPVRFVLLQGVEGRLVREVGRAPVGPSRLM